MEVPLLTRGTLIKDDYLSSITTTLPLLVLLAFVALGQQSAKSIAIEKETNLKEYMLMMGLSRTTLWTSWYIHFMILSLFPVCIGPFSILYHVLWRQNLEVGNISPVVTHDGVTNISVINNGFMKTDISNNYFMCKNIPKRCYIAIFKSRDYIHLFIRLGSIVDYTRIFNFNLVQGKCISAMFPKCTKCPSTVKDVIINAYYRHQM